MAIINMNRILIESDLHRLYMKAYHVVLALEGGAISIEDANAEYSAILAQMDAVKSEGVRI